MAKRSKYNQLVFHPTNPQKYKGSYPICLRSGLEIKCARMFDTNPKILEWSSESVIIPYRSPLDNRVHRYFPDFFVVMFDEKNVKWKYLVEVKPYKQCLPPIASGKKKVTTTLYENKQWILNTSKWKMAEEYCRLRGWRFMKITERDIG